MAADDGAGDYAIEHFWDTCDHGFMWFTCDHGFMWFTCGTCCEDEQLVVP